MEGSYLLNFIGSDNAPDWFSEDEDTGSIEEDAWLWDTVIHDQNIPPPGMPSEVDPTQLTEMIVRSGSQIAPASLKRKRVSYEKTESEPLPDTTFLTLLAGSTGQAGIHYLDQAVPTQEEFKHQRTSFEKQQKCMRETYIKASTLPDGTILAETPIKNEYSNFWEMVCATETSCIFSTANESEGSCLPMLDHSLCYETIRISRSCEKEYNGFLEGKVHEQKLWIEKEPEAKRLIYYFNLSKRDPLLAAEDLHWLCVHMFTYSNSKPVLIHSDSRISGNGMLVAICFYLYQLHQEHKEKGQIIEINLPNLVAYMRCHIRFGMVQSHDEYLVLHQFLVFLQDFEKRDD